MAPEHQSTFGPCCLNASMVILRHLYTLGGHVTDLNPMVPHGHRNLLLEAFRDNAGSLVAG